MPCPFYAPASSADKYDFTIIVRSGDVADGKTPTLDGLDLSGGIAINDFGAVVFRAGFCDSGQPCACRNFTGCNWGLFTTTFRDRVSPAHFVVGTGSIVDGKPLAYVGRPALNNSGTIVCCSDGTAVPFSGIFTPSKALALAGSTISGKTIASLSHDPYINDWGSVVFSANFSTEVSSRPAFSARRNCSSRPEPRPANTWKTARSFERSLLPARNWPTATSPRTLRSSSIQRERLGSRALHVRGRRPRPL